MNDRAVPDACGLDSDWLIWQLADSAFPTGGFAHSLGLESAWQQGEVRSVGELTSFAKTSLRQMRRAAIPFVVATSREPALLVEVDQLFDAFTLNHVANRASRKQGRAFVLAARRVFPVIGDGPVAAYTEDPAVPVHFSAVFGAVLAGLDVPLDRTIRLFVFNQLRTVLAAAVRLNIVGPMEAQAIQYELTAEADQTMAESRHLELQDVAQTAPLLDLWQGAQDRLYSRLFQS